MIRLILFLLYSPVHIQCLGKILVVTELEVGEEEALISGLKPDTENVSVITIRVSRESEAEARSQVCDEISQGVSLVVDLTWTGWPTLRELSLAVDLPYIKVDLPLRVFVRALDDILKGIRGATDAVIILEDEKAMKEILYYVVALSTIRVQILSGLDSSSVEKLRDTRPLPSFYLILASAKAVNTILTTALKSGIAPREGRWWLFFTDFNFTGFNKSLTEVSLTYVTLDPRFCCGPLATSSPCDCPRSMDIVHGMATITLKRAGLALNQALKGLPTASNLKMRTCDISTQNEISNQTHDRFNQLLKTAAPWSYRVRDATGAVRKDPGGNEVWGGYCLDFLQRMAKDLNFDFELVPSEDFGTRDQDGSWNGIVGDLAIGRTDLVLAPLTMTAEREEVIDFVAPYYEQTGISIVIRKPERQTSLFKFMTVLRLEVWLSIVAALVITAIMIWLLDKYSPYSGRNKQLHPYPCREFTLKESFWFAMTSFTPQGGGETPKALSGRTLIAAYWLFVVLMLATFTANLAAFLTVERMQSPVQSLEQLSRQSRINYTVVADSETHSFFRNMKHAEDLLYRVWKEIALNASSDQTQFRVWEYPIKEQYGHILKAIEKAGPVPDAETGFKKVNEQESGWFALIHDSAEIRYEVYRNCNLTEVGEAFAEQPYAVAVQQGSQLNEEISRLILDLQKERYFETLNAKYWNQSSGKGDCYGKDDNEGITLESLGGVFIATLFGLALAMITLGMEIFLHKHKRRAKAAVVPEIFGFYPEYVSKKEFGTQQLQTKQSKLIQPTARIISVFPRNQLY